MFHPAEGSGRVESATSCPNAVLHCWRDRELAAVLESMPIPTTGAVESGADRPACERR